MALREEAAQGHLEVWVELHSNPQSLSPQMQHSLFILLILVLIYWTPTVY